MENQIWTENQYKKLREEAQRVGNHAYAPYSHFHVGAALLAKDGQVFTGCNMENASYGGTICAERGAFAKAISEGVLQFSAIAILGGLEGVIQDYCPPCGICRQVMAEFCDSDFVIVLENGKGEVRTVTLAEILPLHFSAKSMETSSGEN